MNKHLFIVRHAQAESSSSVQRDFERELSSTGVSEACRMGVHLKSLGVSPHVIFTSPALRALTTAQYIAEQLDYDPDNIIQESALYEEFTFQSFAQLVSDIPEGQDSAMVVGHNPKQSYLAEYFTHEEIGSLPTSGVVYIIFENQSWAEITGGSGKLVWFEYPEKIS